MSLAVQLSRERSLLAFFGSVALHAALVASLLASARRAQRATSLPDMVAMPGNAIEVEVPTPELAAPPSSPSPSPALAPALSPSPSPSPEAEEPTPPMDVRSRTEPSLQSPGATPAASAPRPASRKRAARPRPSSETPLSRVPLSSGDAAAQLGSEPRSSAVSSGTFGQEGLAPGVRRLGYAFTRAIPASTPSDSAWQDLPAGHVGTIRIELEVDENNRLGALKRWQARSGEPAPPPSLQRLVERTLILLRAGQFALSGSNRPGKERLIIDVTLKDEDADSDAGPTDVVQKRFDGATPGKPGKAYFRYGSGRALEAKVTIASSGN